MINKINEKIYNYIFSINEDINNKIIESNNEHIEELNKIISEQYKIIADFWDENIENFNDKCVIKRKYVDEKNPTYIYNNFPRMKASAKLEFMNYKLKQIIQSIQENGEFIKTEIDNELIYIGNIGRRKIFDYCEEKNIIKYSGKVFISADNHPAYAIIYDNISAKLEQMQTITNSKIFKTGFLIEYEDIKIIKNSANADIHLVKNEDGKEYIIKVLNKNLNTDKLIRFRNEINFGKISKNEHVLEVIDNGLKQIDGKDYMFYVMPKYKCDFRKLMNEGIENNKILEYFNQILEGVKFIHSKGCFHRDIKPENILFDEENDILVVSDFGIAHFNEDVLIESPETKLTAKMANFQYAAPEQRMRGKVVDYRCDIYSLGLILNEIFTNDIILGSNYRKIGEVNEEFKFLDEIVSKMIAQNPDDRYSSIEEIQFEINLGIDIHNSERKSEELRKIKIEQSDEKDILILEPIKILDVDLDESYTLTITFNHETNELWQDLIKGVDRKEILGCGPEQFKFFSNTATIFLSPSKVDSAPKIIEYFKTWINKVNEKYLKEVEKIRQQDMERKQREIKARLEENKRLQDIRSKIKL